MLIALLLAAATPAMAAPAPPSAPRLANPDFRASRTGSVAGWTPPFAGQYRLDRRWGAGHLAPVEGGPPPGAGSALQVFDPAAWRGRLVRFRARVRLVHPGGSAALAMTVERPPPKRAGFNSLMADRPITSTEWRSYEVVGRIAPDAQRLTVMIVARDRAELLVDHVSLEPIRPNPAPPSAAASAYLDAAIALLRDQHIDSPHADWPRVIANARAEIGGAMTSRDTYWAILGVIGELGEPHTAFNPAPLSAAQASPGAAPAQRESPMPDSRLVDDRFGFVHLPWHFGSTEADRRYRDGLRAMLGELDRHALCGWIVDLRGNTGGNMWPMINGLDPLLGEAPFGQFVTARRAVTYWGRLRGAVVPAPEIGRDPPAFTLRGAALPVAVLIDGRTMSSGEMIAIAFVGRPASRSFGAPTGGYTTGNRIVPLSDGATLILTGTFIRDRTGHDYDGRIAPDEAVDPAQAEAAAIAWLSAQPACAR